MLYKVKQSHDTVEGTKNICCVKGESGVDHTRSDRAITMDSETEFKAIESPVG